MQITSVKVIPVELNLKQPVRMAPEIRIDQVTAIFVRFDLLGGQSAWGCTVAHPDLTGEDPQDVLRACRDGADLVPDLHPLNIEYSLAELNVVIKDVPSALCAFDLAYHDLICWAAGMPLYRFFGGYRNRIQTSVTIPIASVEETVAMACSHAKEGFRILKIKGGIDAHEDVQRVRAIQRALPNHTLRLDADGGYSAHDALDVARALEDSLEMLEQPISAGDLDGLRNLTKHSPIPILADQSVTGPESALKLATGHCVDGLSIKLTTCGGLGPARQIDAIARAAKITTLVGCVIEPALMIAAGLGIALSSPNVRYGDLDGHLALADDPTQPGFVLKEGELISSEVPGLGCKVNLG